MKINLKKNKIIFITAAGIILLLIIYIFRSYNNKKNENGAKEIKIAQIEKKDISVVTTCNGKIISNLDVEIKSKASGEIINLPYDISDKVKKNDLIVELDPVDEERKVQQARANMAAASAKLLKAENNLKISEYNFKTAGIKANADSIAAFSQYNSLLLKEKREKELLENKFTSLEEYENIKTSMEQAFAQYQNAIAKVEELKTQKLEIELKKQDVLQAESDYKIADIELKNALERLKETKIYSPIDGVVTDRYVQIGQIISSGINNVSGGSPLMAISDLSKIYVMTYVDESEIGKIKLNMPANVTLDAFPNKIFKGKICQIGAKGKNNNNVITFDVKVEILDKKKNMLKPEMTANVEIIIAKVLNAIAIPNEAVIKKKTEHGMKYFVEKVMPNNTTQKIEVQKGISNDIYTQIISGLDINDKVVINSKNNTSKWEKSDNNQTRSIARASRMMRRGK